MAKTFPVRINFPVTFQQQFIGEIVAAAVKDGLQLDWNGPAASEDEIVEAVMEASRQNSTVVLVHDRSTTHHLAVSHALIENCVYHHVQWQDPETGKMRTEMRDFGKRREICQARAHLDIHDEKKSEKPFFMSGGPGWEHQAPAP
jgi:hypothetical protein